jgi:hypothetical protein
MTPAGKAAAMTTTGLDSEFVTFGEAAAPDTVGEFEPLV